MTDRRYTVETAAHMQMEADLDAWVEQITPKLKGVKIKRHRPRTQDSGPVRTMSTIWLDRLSGTAWPVLISVQCRKGGSYSAKWAPRKRDNQGLPPCDVDPGLAKAAQVLVDRITEDLKLSGRVDPDHVPPETPAQRRAREAAEARAREEAEAKPFYAIFGEGEE